jgi:hypothetical protein
MKMPNELVTRCNLIGLIVVSLAVSGCRSGSSSWKMPGSSMFSWNRQPDATTLAGQSNLPQYPESPANRYEPNAIASVAAQTPSQTSGPSVASVGTASSAYGVAAQTVAAPKTGLASQANGFQTGPYQMSESAGYPPTTTTASSSAVGLPNPYGGTYAGTGGATSVPSIALPGGVQQSVATAQNAVNTANGYANAANAYANGVANSISSLPSYPFSTVSTGTAGTGTSSPTTAAMSTPAFPELPQGVASGASSAFPNPLAATPPATSAYQGSTTLSSGYRPGTTGRSTGYDFSSGGAGSATQAPTAPSTNSQPSFSLPPNTATQSLPLLR